MSSTIINQPKIELLGISVRTNNLREASNLDAQIGGLWQRYLNDRVATSLSHRLSPGITYVIYTEYETDASGDYTCFIGEAVSPGTLPPPGYQKMIIEEGKYKKYTSKEGSMPQVCIDLWQKIWQASPTELGGTRLFKTDFELYDMRAEKSQQTTLDIYIGINPLKK